MVADAQPAPPLTAEQQAEAEKLYRRVQALRRSGVYVTLLSAGSDGSLRLRPVGHAIDVFEGRVIVSTDQ